ncbi:MAG TPA: MobF family relaxase [Candidatus Sulfotelmatobacter sp.]|nr:MobF family relaxase [Candidatus Sulfotelmatobacter sp.]
MLTMKAQYSLKNAEDYFREHLRVGDYYMEGRSVTGQWIGEGAIQLGLSGVTNEKEFVNLCRNLHPQSGEQLTPRLNSKRISMDKDGNVRESANRRVFYDFTLSPPKSVSIAALVGNDKRIIQAHDEAIQIAMRHLQMFAATRVRKNHQYSHRNTGNMVGAVFRHDTSRALDPHLHSHCILFNATWDTVEGRWKALEACDMVAVQKFVRNVYYHEMVRSLQRLGYGVENNPRGDFEIAGVSKELIGRFSKRHDEIDRKTKELLEREPEKANQNIQVIRANIAHNERARKIKDVGIVKLQFMWNKQLSWKEWWLVNHLDKHRSKEIPQKMTAGQAVSWAEQHLFERRSVVHEHEIWCHALEQLRGQNVSLAEIQAATKERGYIRDEYFNGQVTTREVLQRELDIVQLAQYRTLQYQPLARDYHKINHSLDYEQEKAAKHILSSRNFVTLFRGGAGTGKSFTLREVKDGLAKERRIIHVLAPQRQQVADLERDGFRGTETVSAFLAQKSMRWGAVVIVDEAGQIGGQQMLELLSYVQANQGRVILSGDTRQHGAVEASDALRAIEKYAGLGYAELTNIRRQNPASAKTQRERRWLEQYKLAVDEAQRGKFSSSFDRLDNHGAIISCTLANQREKLAEHFLEHFTNQQSTVVVSQSWNEIHRLNDTIRQSLKSQKLIGDDETTVTALERQDLTDAQKRDKRFYQSDSVLVFNRPAAGFKAGSVGKLRGITDKHLLIEAENRIRPVPVKELDRITVCQPKKLSLSSGDRLQLKANDKSQDGRKLANGELVTVKKIHTDGRITLDDGRTLPKHYRQFVRGYAVTSYAAQGKTVDYVLFSDSAVKAATNEKQWYVTISRGRKGVKIFTADKIQLRQNIAHSGNRTLAMDMKPGAVQKLASALGRGVAYALNVQHSQRKSAERQAEMLRQAEALRQQEQERQAEALRRDEAVKQSQAVKPVEKTTESIKPRERIRESVKTSEDIRRQLEMSRQKQNQKQSKGMRI